jgi:GH15 family glucan-1,4-alpha-glucosidase
VVIPHLYTEIPTESVLEFQASNYDVPIPNIWKLALSHFDNILSYANHLGMFSEEVAISGEQMGNTPQAFSHLACISAAINLERLGQGED